LQEKVFLQFLIKYFKKPAFLPFILLVIHNQIHDSKNKFPPRASGVQVPWRSCIVFNNVIYTLRKICNLLL